MCDPVGILIENGIVQITCLEFEIGVDNRFYLIIPLHRLKPENNRALELLISLVLGFMLHIKHWRQVAILQFHVFDEMCSLLIGWCMNTIEMIGTSGKSVFTSLIKVISEVLIQLCGAFCGFDHHKTDGTLIDAAIILQLIPVDTSLMMRNVDTMNLIAVGIVHISIKRTPAETERSDKEIIEEPDVA